MSKEEINGGDALIRALADENIDLIFGYPGGAALHIYDAIYKQNKVQHILVRHEQAAVHAADGFARATGKPGVALVKDQEQQMPSRVLQPLTWILFL